MLNADKEIAGLSLRIYLESNVKSGIKYGLVFDNKHSNDEELRFDDISVVIDPVSAKHLHGAQMEFVDDISGGGFRITQDNTDVTCACAKSIEA